MRPLVILNLVLLWMSRPPTVNSQSFQSSNLPIIQINTLGSVIVNEPKTRAHMSIINNSEGLRNNITDPPNDYTGYIGIETRGSSSQMWDKKNYAVELWTEDGRDTSATVLGLPEEEDWVLHGPYSDKTLMRNVLAYKLAGDLGRYASRSVFCELVINNDYRGVYVLLEKVKRDKNRVDIAKLDPDEISGDDLTGGYIVKLDKYDGSNSGEGWESPYEPPYAASQEQYIYFQFEYPRNDDIVFAQREYIRKYVTAFEDALFRPGYNDLITGYQAYSEVTSFVDFAIVNELTRNVDGYRLSTFLYKDKDSDGGKLTMGPVWDFNLGFGNADYCDGGSAYGWAYRFNLVCPQDFWQVPFWWFKLFNDPEFRELLKERWKELRAGPYRSETILNYIDSTTEVLQEAGGRNFRKWNILGYYVWPNNYIGYTYEDEINYMKDWIVQRLEWLDINFEAVPVVGLGEPVLKDNILIFPNPFKDYLFIRNPVQGIHGMEFCIYDLHGRKLYQSGLLTAENSFWNGLDMDGKPVTRGIYLISFISGSQVVETRKIIKN